MNYASLRTKYSKLAINRTEIDKCPKCGRPKKFYVTRKMKDLLFNCYVCGLRGRIPMDKPTLAQRRQQKIIQDKLDNLELPQDFTTTLPPEARTFMMKYALDYGLLEKYKVGFSNKMGRFIYPLYFKGELKGIQTRLLVDDPNESKYKTHGQKPPYFCPHATSDVLVVTEDILSAIKLNEYTNSLCLLGTKTTFKHIKEVLKRKYSKVYIWLDNDFAGHKGRKEFKEKLEMYGIPVEIIKSEGDPKETFHHIIKEKINID